MRLGIFGGTFDPIHTAHIAIAEAARNTFALEKVLVIPAANPPHKRGATASFAHRYRMVELACQGHKGLEPSMLEAAEERSYSMRTIENLRASLTRDDSLFFIIGADAFGEIQTWHRWQDVVASVDFVVVTRPSADYRIPDGARVHRLDDWMLPVSSSAIRKAIGDGERPVELPEAVYNYIGSHGLYQG